MTDEKNTQYVLGDKRTKQMLFVFLGIWIVAGLIFRWLSEEKLGQIGQVADKPSGVIGELESIAVWYWILPMAFFFLIQAIYLVWMGVKTLQTGIYPPTGARMPFRTKVRTGTGAKIIAGEYFLGGICSIVIIVLLIQTVI